MREKSFIKLFVLFSILLAGIIAVFIYIVDPLFYYREQSLYRPQYLATERYQMPGLLKNREYETLFTSTSMGRNFVESHADEKMKTVSFNGALPASTAREQAMVADLAIRHQDLKTIIWEINYYSFAEEPDWTLEPEKNTFPHFLYDDSKWNDIKYLFNSYSFEVMYDNILANKEGDERKRDVETLYKFGGGVPPQSIESMAAKLDGLEQSSQLPKYEHVEYMMKSFEANVIPLVKNNPDIKFKLFYAPYPIVNHVSFYRKNPQYLEERAKFKEAVYEKLSQYDNVQLYDFQTESSITYVAKNYMDSVHYYRYINDWMIDYMAEYKGISSKEENDKIIEEFRNQIINFNVAQLK
ncbi:hypothetical protein [Mesobacillus selenatarsenatis]|uniref:Uncharacterized protein n=1 Tax=Mesobacillus selenatarsenatis TaxID=388741 RepID=A0A846TLJ2_9BACI|nr:hypothetical protein [Mesobacillus selenatarsenatis]NKE06814.1 hypothetical protein [Mesobacillus selenatarsenatis]